MNTGSKLDLSETPLSNLQLTFDKKKQILRPGTQSLTTNTIKFTKSDSCSSKPVSYEMSDSRQSQQQPLEDNETDNLLDLEDIQRQQSTLEKRVLERVPIFKCVQDDDIKVFLSKIEFVFDLFKYPDAIRIIKTQEKFDDSFHPIFTSLKNHQKITWNEFMIELSKPLSGSTLSTELTNESKHPSDGFSHRLNLDEKSSILEMLRNEVMPFTGVKDPRQWFTNIDLKFYHLKLGMADRIKILPYFFAGGAMIWFSINRRKILSYIDFCELFFLEYLRSESLLDRTEINNVKNERFQRQTSMLNDDSSENLADCPQTLGKQSVNHHAPPSKSSSVLSNASDISLTISKALIDRFVKDPMGYAGGKQDVNAWIDEIEQQFSIMNVCDSDKLNLIHICLTGEALIWYRQNRKKFLSWALFIDEITNSFSSNLQRDMAFEKLKKYRQSIHQSVNQYYNSMIKLMKQADPVMNESTKVQYLMNGLRSSLSTETRRNYPKTSDDLLEQAKAAEELTTMNNPIVPYPSIDEESESSSTASPTHSHRYASRNTFRQHSYSSGKSNAQCNAIHSSNDRRRYSDRNNGSSSVNWKNSNRSSHSYEQPNSFRPSSTFLNNNYYSTQDARHSQQRQRTMTSSQGYQQDQSMDYRARNHHRFEGRSQ